MSLGIAFKGPEGIVLAADSRVTLNNMLKQPNGQQVVIASTFDNATKLLKVKGQEFVGAVTYGVGAIGQQAPRTAHSFIPEFEASLQEKHNGNRLSVEQFAQELSDFFLDQWNTHMKGSIPQGGDMVFLVGGYDEGSAYGRVFDFFIPNKPKPNEQYADTGQFGAVWGGQREHVDRLLSGYDPRVLDMVGSEFQLDQAKIDAFKLKLAQLTTPIPFAFLPLQDSVDLSIFLIRTTIRIQTWLVGVRGVGGAIDVATITKTDGFRAVQVKQIVGENNPK
jgi:hypothetical protein